MIRQIAQSAQLVEPPGDGVGKGLCLAAGLERVRLMALVFDREGGFDSDP